MEILKLISSKLWDRKGKSIEGNLKSRWNKMTNKRNTKRPSKIRRRVKNFNRYLGLPTMLSHLNNQLHSPQWVHLNPLSMVSNSPCQLGLSLLILHSAVNNRLKATISWDRGLTWRIILPLKRMPSANLDSNSTKKNSKSRLKIENVRKMMKNAKLKKKRN